MSKSNLHGRLFEYLIVDYISKKIGNNCHFSKNTIDQNLRDKSKLNHIDPNQLIHFQNSLPVIYDWISKNINTHSIKIERLNDEFGKKGDVTDIKIITPKKVLNLSFKNNNVSIKHQRPGLTPKRLGFKSSDSEYKSFNHEYKLINKNFYDKYNKLIPNLTLYRQIDKNEKKTFLYKPVCNLVSEFINKNSSCSNTYQNFLISIVEHKQIILWPKKIEIKSFDNIPSSKYMTSQITDLGYVEVNFHNSIILRMRLHSASSKISNTGSLKFDTKIHEMNIPTEILNL